MPRLRSSLVVVSVLALLAGVSLLVYGRWAKPLVDASAAIEAGEPARALAAYAISGERFKNLTVTQQLFADDFSRLTHNRLALLYRSGQYDEVLEAAEAAPPTAAPHYWVGCALFAKGTQEEKPETRLEWFSRAEDEFKLALAAAPDDWDTKYNFELSARLTALLRRQPKAAPPSLMQLLRPSKEGPLKQPVKKTG